MGEGVRAAFGLAGGLALFLFGMENMSRALQQAAGERMRGFLRRITRTPLTGALAGLLVTAVLQSSSATTVMVIGFVSAGLMELPQAVAVVFGANVGTTMTAQLVAFRLADWVFPILFAGVLVWLLARRERTRQLGLAVFSFGLLFDGIEVLSGAMAPLAEHPVFLHWMTQVRHTPLPCPFCWGTTSARPSRRCWRRWVSLRMPGGRRQRMAASTCRAAWSACWPCPG